MIRWNNAAIVAPFLNLRDKQYREYLRLLIRYGSRPRYREQRVKFQGYRIRVPDAVSFIFQFKEIFVSRSYSFASQEQHPVIFDCGANIGLASLYFKSIFPSARVLAFEADPLLVSVLRDNLSGNGARDVEIIPKAVWVHSKGVSFTQEGADAGAIRFDKAGVKVPSVRLKAFLRREKKVDFLKMDVEGAETEVLLDCGADLKIVRSLFVEYHGWPGDSQRLDELLRLLSKSGFRYALKSVSPLEQPLSKDGLISSSSLQLNIHAERDGGLS